MKNNFKEMIRNGCSENIPIWFMRQAGRYLESYRDIRKNYSMKDICKNYSIAANVSYSPIKEIGVDAAIVFSDILLILENMGYLVDYPGNGSPVVIKSSDQIPDKIISHASEVIKKFKENYTDFPIIGFSGAPLTTISYALNGKSDPELRETRRLISKNQTLIIEEMKILNELIIKDVREQIRVGAEAIQIFDSWLGYLPYNFIRDNYIKFLSEISSEIHSANSKLIFFSTGSSHLWGILKEIAADFYSIDWRSEIYQAQDFFGQNIGVQGNLDPVIASGDRMSALMQTNKILNNLRHRENYIFNLGHGVLPETDPEVMKNIVEAVHKW
ncbi:MAG: uroporphyrinogen decarboxylase family protein [Thermoplasmataceae archaeon]